MSSISTINTLELYFGRSTPVSLRERLFDSSEKPLSLRKKLLEINSINQEKAAACWEASKDYVIAFHNSFFVLPETEQQAVRDQYLSMSNFGSDVSGPVAAFSISFPQLPTIPIPGGINININDIADAIIGKLEGILENLAQTIKEIILGIPEELFFIIEKFVSRIIQFGELLKDGKVAKALGVLLQSVALLIRDVAGSVVTIVVNAVVDILGGIIGGFLFGRMLTQEEKDFAHTIFHGQINLTFIQVVEFALENSGMVAASVIYIDGEVNLKDVNSRELFAHELTHVWQNQILMGAGTRTATKENLSHLTGGAPDPYQLSKIDNSTSWSNLGAEQRAALVGAWQLYLDIIISNNFPGYQLPKDFPLDTPNLVDNARRILTNEGLF